MRALNRISTLVASVAVVATALAQPQYQIFDIGVTQVGDTASQGFNASPGGVAVGRSITSNSASQAFTWTVGGGRVALPNLAGRPHAVSNAANENGIVVGTAATTLFGSSRLPVVWTNGVVSQLPLPGGETLGDANGVNAAGVAVGSVDGGSNQQAVIYNGGTATIITQTTPGGSFFVTAFGINNLGRIVGQGIDPNNAARNVGIVYDMGGPAAFEVGALPGANGALNFGVGNGGHVVGSSMMNQGSGMPFIWSEATGMVAIPLATGTSEGSARGVNSSGWVVGQDSSAFSIPFLWDGTTTYRLADLLPPGSGWDLSTNTSSSALGISDNYVIVGTGVHNGETHAYAMVPVAPTPTPTPLPTPCGLIIAFSENFDGVIAPALPAGWTTSFTPGPANCTPTGTCALGTNWATTTVTPDTPPNCAFHNDPGCVTDSFLDTPTFLSGPTNGTLLMLRHSYDLESGLDGAVLEISINGGPFVDFVAAGGGGLYNGTISSGSFSPIAGRSAWTGNSGGYVTTFAQMPVSAANQNVRLRFRLATDCSGAGTGWRIDAIAVQDNIGCQNPTPTPTASPTPAVTPTPSSCTIISLNEGFDTVTPPALPAGWTSSVTPGPANCIPSGTCALGTAWTTSATNPATPPNCAFHNAPGCVTDSALDTPPFIYPAGANLIFENSFDLENGLDGAVLEISVNGGPFTDFIAAGGTFMSGGYNGTISTTSFSPIAGRQAWTGNSNGYLFVFAGMPNAAAGQSTVLRFRLGTDCSGTGTGWRLDDIKVIYFVPCPTPTPTPASPTPTPSPTLTPPPPTPTPTPPGTPTPTPTATPPSTPSPTPTATPVAQALNLSTRMRVQTGENVGIGGFIVTGTAPKHVLLRAIGPSLNPAIPNRLADPVMELHGPGAFVTIINDNWRDDPMQEIQIIASGIPPTQNSESAIDATLSSGSYTAIVSGKNNTSGIGLVEAYDLNQAVDSKLANISTRAFVDTGDDVVIAGFILGGNNGADRIVVRGIGPSLVGVANALADPILELRDGDGALLAANNDWQDDPTQAAELTAAGLAPTNDLESAIAATLPPGPFTVLLAGLNNGTGVGLVEVYDRGAP